VTECSQGPNDKDAQALVHKITEADGNTESIIQGGNGATVFIVVIVVCLQGRVSD
jgi:hypothetical protein